MRKKGLLGVVMGKVANLTKSVAKSAGHKVGKSNN